MEMTFIADGIKYRYGLSLFQGKIKEEWLYYTPKTRETILFERDGQLIEINKKQHLASQIFYKGWGHSEDKRRCSLCFCCCWI